jgi:hypothetical protein
MDSEDISALGFWIVIAAFVVAGAWTKVRREAEKHETLRRIVEKTGSIDETKLKELFSEPSPEPTKPGTGYRVLRITGTIVMFLGGLPALFGIAVWRKGRHQGAAERFRRRNAGDRRVPGRGRPRPVSRLAVRRTTSAVSSRTAGALVVSRLAAADLQKAADTLVIALACAGDDSAFSELLRRRQARVRKFMYHLCRHASQGDDLAQQVFLTAGARWGDCAARPPSTAG